LLQDTARNAALIYDAHHDDFFLTSVAGIPRGSTDEFLTDETQLNDLKDKTIRWITSPARERDSFPRFVTRSAQGSNGGSSSGNHNASSANSVGSTSSSGSSTGSSPLHGSSGRKSAVVSEGAAGASAPSVGGGGRGGSASVGPPTAVPPHVGSSYTSLGPNGLMAHHGAAAMGLLGLEKSAFLHAPPGTPYLYDYHHHRMAAMAPMVPLEVDMESQDAYHQFAHAAASNGAAQAQALHSSASYAPTKASGGPQSHYRIPIGLVNGTNTPPVTTSAGGSVESSPAGGTSASATATSESVTYAAPPSTIPTLAYHPAWMGHMGIPSRFATIPSRPWPTTQSNSKSTLIPSSRGN